MEMLVRGVSDTPTPDYRVPIYTLPTVLAGKVMRSVLSVPSVFTLAFVTLIFLHV